MTALVRGREDVGYGAAGDSDDSVGFFGSINLIQMEEGAIKTIGKYSYFTQKCLGEGSFGKVFEGFENNTKEKIAVKKVDFKTIEKDPYLERAIHE